MKIVRYVRVDAVEQCSCGAWANDLFEVKGRRLCQTCAEKTTRRKLRVPGRDDPPPKIDYSSPLSTADVERARHRWRLW